MQSCFICSPFVWCYMVNWLILSVCVFTYRNFGNIFGWCGHQPIEKEQRIYVFVFHNLFTQQPPLRGARL